MTEQQGQEPAQNQNEGQQAQGQEPSQQGHQQQNQGQQGLSPEAMASELAEARREAAQYRTQRNQFEQQATQFQQQFEQMRNGFAQALGLGGQEEQDPQQLQNQLQQTQGQFRRERLQNVVLMDSLRQGADPGLTWAHLFASGDLDDVDINASDFREQVSQRVEAAMQATPKLKADYAPPQPSVGGGSNPANAQPEPLPEVNPFKRESFNLTEQARITKADPDLARRLQNAAKAAG